MRYQQTSKAQKKYKKNDVAVVFGTFWIVDASISRAPFLYDLLTVTHKVDNVF